MCTILSNYYKISFFHQSCIKPWSFHSDQDIPPKVKVSCLMRLLLLGCLWQCHSNSGNRRTSGCATKWFKGHKQGKKIKYRYTVNFKVKLTSVFTLIILYILLSLKEHQEGGWKMDFSQAGISRALQREWEWPLEKKPTSNNSLKSTFSSSGIHVTSHGETYTNTFLFKR